MQPVKSLAGLDSFAARTAAAPRRAEPTQRCSTRSGRRWTTTSTHPRPRRCCSTRCARRTRRSTPATPRQRRSPRRRSEIAAAFGLELKGASDVPDDVLAQAAALDAARAAKDFGDRRRDPRCAAGRRLDRRDRQAGHHRPPLNANRPPPLVQRRPAQSPLGSGDDQRCVTGDSRQIDRTQHAVDAVGVPVGGRATDVRLHDPWVAIARRRRRSA